VAFKLDDDAEAYSDINVTPLVDVMLVLLVIFMVTAPMLHQGIDVKLPKSVSQNLAKTPEDPLILSITKAQVYYLNETVIPKAQLRDRMKLILKTRKDKAVYLKADRSLPYGIVVETMDTLNRIGVENLGMVTELESEKDKP
jgi:biopolymer transport protein TolR